MDQLVSLPARGGSLPARAAIKDNIRPFRWVPSKTRKLLILDQLLLPAAERWIECRTHKQAARCIVTMQVRGAPAIGCVAAYALVLAAHEKNFKSGAELARYLESAGKALAATRPTAVNLFWAIERMVKFAKEQSGTDMDAIRAALEREAENIYSEDLAANHAMGKLGASLIPENSTVLTHCNAGSLATSGWGTALGVIRSAYQQGKVRKVLVDETRPYLQGARLTAWELKKDGIPFELITDNMAAHMMKSEKVNAVVVGSDRIAANGDVANKIGTYGLAVLCQFHKIPFYAAAPTSTIDLKTESGDRIPIEERSVKEVTHIKDFAIAPTAINARHPAFDVTPHKLVTAIITEKGIARAPYGETLRAFA